MNIFLKPFSQRKITAANFKTIFLENNQEIEEQFFTENNEKKVKIFNLNAENSEDIRDTGQFVKKYLKNVLKVEIPKVSNEDVDKKLQRLQSFSIPISKSSTKEKNNYDINVFKRKNIKSNTQKLLIPVSRIEKEDEASPQISTLKNNIKMQLTKEIRKMSTRKSKKELKRYTTIESIRNDSNNKKNFHSKQEQLKSKINLNIKKFQSDKNQCLISQSNKIAQTILLNGRIDFSDENEVRNLKIPIYSQEKSENGNLLSYTSRRFTKLKENEGNSKNQSREYRKMRNIYDSASEDELQYISPLLIHPDKTFKEIWDFVVFIATIYTIIYVPYEMAFNDNSNNLIAIIIDLFSDLIFILDVIFHFFIPYTNTEYKVIYSFKEIGINYIFSWFLIDLTSSIPINSVLNIINYSTDEGNVPGTSLLGNKLTNITKLSRLYRLMKLIRLVKLIKISKVDKNKQLRITMFEDESISSNLRRFLKFLLYFLILNHMLACTFTFVASLDYPNWIVESNLEDSADLDLYVASMYFNLYTIYTIGYGNIVIVNAYERAYNIMILIIGVMMYTFAVSSLSNIVLKTDEKTQKYNKNINFLDDVKIKYNISSHLYSKLKRCISYDSNTNTEGRINLFLDIPQILLKKLICGMHKDIIENFSFLRSTNKDFCARVLLVLKPLKSVKGELLIKENEFIEEMIFVKRGCLSVGKTYRDMYFKLIQIGINEHFGEIFVLLHEKCLYNVVVKSKYTELLLLKKTDLISICTEFPAISEIIFNKSTYNLLMIQNTFNRFKKNYRRAKSISNPKKSTRIKTQKKNVKFKIPSDHSENDKNKEDFEIILENEEENEEESSTMSPKQKFINISRIEGRRRTRIENTLKSIQSHTSLSNLLNSNIEHSDSPKLFSQTISPGNSIKQEYQGSQIFTFNNTNIFDSTSPTKRNSMISGTIYNTKRKPSARNSIISPGKRNSLIPSPSRSNIRRNAQILQGEMLQTMRRDSLLMNSPQMFYALKFDKWKIDNLTEKLDNMFKIIKNSR